VNRNILWENESVSDIGTYKGTEELERLFQEIQITLSDKRRTMVAVAGLPGVEKTNTVKRFTRLDIGTITQNDMRVFDDNMIYKIMSENPQACLWDE